ncbi:MAG: P-loop NTPase fold protein, partial [Planctomycetota bacterium]
IRKQLDETYAGRAKTVWFSPWEYQFESSPVLPLLHTIREEFGLSGKNQKTGMKLLNTLSTLGGELLLTALTGGKVSIKDVIGLGKNYEKKYFEVKTLSKRLKSAYEDDIKSLLEQPTKRLVMFIDDLDRCQPEICIRMLESLKLFLNVDRCVYFMGLDNRIIESTMEKKYPDKEIEGKDYLQKIIQVPFQIPLIDDETIGSYISALSPGEEFKSLQSIFITCVGRNPRQVKRFLNTFRLNDILARQILQDNYEKEILIKLLGIQFEDTGLYGFLAEHPRRLLDMEKLFQKEEIIDEESRMYCEEYIGNERIRKIFTIGKQFWEVEDVLEKYFTLTALTLGEEERQKEVIGKARVKKPARPFEFPLSSSLHNQTSSEENFVGRDEALDTITEWYRREDVRIGSLIGWGGVGKSVLVRKWYDELEANKIQPDGIFWWGFYRNASLEQFLNALLRYVSGGQIEPETIKGTWEKTDRIKDNLGLGAYLIILDGFEQMQNAETGDGFGRMKHRELTALLRYWADVPKASGMLLITSRFPLKDLDDWENRGYESLQLGDLNITDALSMLKNRGVKGSDEEMTEVINRYKCHALSLTSLAGYLVRYYGGDIKQAPDIEFVLGDKRRFRDLNNLLRRYAEKMSEAEHVFLNIFSLFRKEVTEDDFVSVFRKKTEVSTYNDVLVKMSNLDFRDLVGGLVDWRLISYDETKKTYSTHPLIKVYFESDFESKYKKLCHKRIYEYIGEYAPEEADTLEEMQPLFEQVYYGCAGGLYDDVLVDVYWEKIYRGNEDFLTQKLGAWETALSIVKNFFPESDFSKMPLVSKKSDQGWLINEAGLALLNTGRSKEAEKTFLKGIKVAVQDNNEINASASHQNLAELQFRTGELESGRISAEKALASSEKAESDKYIVNSKAYLGWILYMLGKTEEVEKHFEMADKIEIKIS